MPAGELRNLICSILPAEALSDCTINSDIRAKIDCVVQTNPDFMNSTQSAVNWVLQTLTCKTDQRDEGMALMPQATPPPPLQQLGRTISTLARSSRQTQPELLATTDWLQR